METINKRFTVPKDFTGSYFKCKRVPRKFKKRWKHILQGERYDFLELNQKLWFIQWHTNPEYNRFLINYLVNKDGTRNNILEIRVHELRGQLEMESR